MSDGAEPATSVGDRRAKRQQGMQRSRSVDLGVGRGTGPRAALGGGLAAIEEARGDAAVAPDPAAAQRRKVLGRMARILTDTPADAAGTVPGTPFTPTGVAALVDTLGKRSRNEGAPGARMASRILTFLQTKPDGEADDVHGVSLQKLQRLAKLAVPGTRRGARP